jgi:hypothetical protein
VTVTSSFALRAESLALSRKTYVPAAPNDAVVEVALALANVTVPGPLILLQVEVSVEPCGKPSSVAVPLSVADEGRVTV